MSSGAIFVVGLYVTLWAVCVSSHEPWSHRSMTRLKKSHPSLTVLGKRLYNMEMDKNPKSLFNRNELEILQFIMRFVPFRKGMPMGDILADTPADLQVLSLSAAGIVKHIRSDPNIKQFFYDGYTQYVERQNARQKGSIQTQNAQETSFEQCAIDYDAFVAPITNPLAELILDECSETGYQPPCRNGSLPEAPVYDWASRMLDAMGKIPEGIIEGKLHWIGSFEYCEETHINYTINGQPRQFDGQYARLEMIFPLGNASLPTLLGICTPRHCSDAHIERYITEDNLLLATLVHEILQIQIGYVYTQRHADTSTDIRFQTAIAIFIIIIAISVSATIYDGFFRKFIIRKHLKSIHVASEEKTDHTYSMTAQKRLELAFVSFSFYSNFTKIFSLEDVPGHIPALDGIRVLSYLYLTTGMTGVIAIFNEVWPTKNLITALIRLPKLWYFNAVINFFLSMDSFLYLAGLLITYWWLKKWEQRKSGNWKLNITFTIQFLFLKWWRIFPTLAFTQMLYVGFAPYSFNGPLLPNQITDATNCYETWWATLLLVNNFVRTDKTCMTWTPQISLLIQLHLAALVILVVLVLYRKAGYALLLAFFTAHIGAAAGVATGIGNNFGWYGDFFTKPWCRAGPYIIGMATGILLHQPRKLPFKWNLLHTLGSWIATGALILVNALITYDFNREGSSGPWSKPGQVAFHTLNHSGWGLGLSFMTLLCAFGKGGIVNSILSLKMWQPLSRIVYQAFMMQSILIFTWLYYRMDLWYLDLYHLLYAAIGHWSITLAWGIVLSCLFQYPFSYGFPKAVLCNDVFKWIMHGRYPEEIEEAGNTMGVESYSMKCTKEVASGIPGAFVTKGQEQHDPQSRGQT